MRFPETEILICFGFSEEVCQRGARWVASNRNRRIFFIGVDKKVDHPRFEFFPLKTPFDIEPLANRIAWQSVFLSVGWLILEEIPWMEFFRKAFDIFYRGANLLLSDGADFGVGALKAAQENLKRPFRWALDLEGAFQKVPALIVGAGPSLAKSQDLLAHYKEKALIFAAGSANELLSFSPHVRGRVDPQAVQKKDPRGRSAVCFSPRAASQQIKKEEGPLLLAPDSHFAFLNWIADCEVVDWSGGWTATNFLTEIAWRWGCDPIIFVGVDACGRGTEETLDRHGKKVKTQTDWLEALRWTGELAKKHPDRRWINATSAGLSFPDPIEERDLSELTLEPLFGLEERLNEAIESLPLRQGKVRFPLWKDGLREKKEWVEEKLLTPFWHLWQPLFRRTLIHDSHPISEEEKMELHKKLFFEQVIKEHMNALF